MQPFYAVWNFFLLQHIFGWVMFYEVCVHNLDLLACELHLCRFHLGVRLFQGNYIDFQDIFSQKFVSRAFSDEKEQI